MTEAIKTLDRRRSAYYGGKKMATRDLCSTKDLSREDWLKTRKQGLGGSDISAIFGLNRWKSPVDVYLDKAGLSEPAEESEYMYWGAVLEEVVAREFTRRTGYKVRRRNAVLVNDDYPYLLANIDRELVGERVGLECKTASAYKAAEWEDDKVPDEYMLQVQHYMAVTGYKAWWLAILIGGNTFRILQVDRDDEIIELIKDRAQEFWETYIVPQVIPPLDGTSRETLLQLYPESNGETVQLTSEINRLVGQRQAINASIKALQEEKDALETKIIGAIGSAEVGESRDYTVKYKTTVTRRLDTKKLRKEEPELAQKYTTESSQRRFTVKERVKE